MSISLFAHNKTAYESVQAMLREVGKAAVVHPTGTGKSFIGFKLCEDHPTKTVCWLSPSEYIFKTQLENIRKAGGGEFENIVFFTYAKLMQLSDEDMAAIEADYIILDEFHRCGADMWGAGVERLLSIYADVPLLGLSATAIRYLDNRRNMADELFDGNIASEMTLGEAIVRGILAAPKYVLSVFSYRKDLERYKTRINRAKSAAVRDSAERYLEALRRALDRADGLDQIFDKHMTDRAGKYIVFCANYEHLQDMVAHVPAWFSKVDPAPRVYSAYSDDPETNRAFEDFKKDNSPHLKLLFCIDMLNEGIHVDDISGVILFRPTVSPIIYKQQIGRALAAGKQKQPIIFDIVNNIENLYSIGTIEQEMQVAVNYYHYLGQNDEIVNERFQIIDELKDAKTLFDGLNETLTASWELMYSHAEAYYKEHGNLAVQRRYKTAEGYSLGNWILTQRKVRSGEMYGSLNAERIAKLDAIGMIWESIKDQAWQRYFNAAREYYEKNHDLNVRATYKTDEGVCLGGWINNLRTYRRNGIQQNYLTEDRIAALDRLGMIWSVPDYIWEENYAEAMDFYRHNGHLNIPVDYISSKGLKIGMWIMNQRAIRAGKIQSGTLTEDKIERLNTIGMAWKGKAEQAWDRGYLASVVYHQTYGHLNVPTGYVAPDGYKLGVWIADRRQNGRAKHSLERQQALDALGMVWTKPDPWEFRYALIKQYYDEHGHLNVPADYKMDGVWLSKWLNEQRQIYIGNRGEKRLTEDQIRRLEALGMTWESRNLEIRKNAWEVQFERAKRYFDSHGTLTPTSAELTTAEEKKLTAWVIRQRAQYAEGKLDQQQIERLNTIGMVWSLDDQWDIGFAHAKTYYEEQGNLLVNINYVCVDGYALGKWVSNQRMAYQPDHKSNKNGDASVERKHRLESIGMVWSVYDARWEEAFVRAELFYRNHGHLSVPRQYVAEDGFDVYEWVTAQRKKFREGELSSERITRLESIGMDWLTSVERDWEDNYARAEKYYRTHGRLTDMPCTYVDEEGVPLGRWLWRIKTHKVKLKTSGANGNQIERLARLGVLVEGEATGHEYVRTASEWSSRGARVSGVLSPK